MKIHRLLALLPALLAGLFPCALAEETDEFARAMELGFLETSAQRVTPGWSGSVNPNGGGFEPVFIEKAEKFLHEYLKDDTSTIVWPGE